MKYNSSGNKRKLVMDELVVLLKDQSVLNYMLKNDSLLLDHYTILEGETPRKFLINASNRSYDEFNGEEYFAKKLCNNIYKTKSYYVTKMLNCMFCDNLLDMKRHLNLQLYDDVLGSSKVTLLAKFCKICKLTYYPGYCENYKEQKHMEFSSLRIAQHLA